MFAPSVNLWLSMFIVHCIPKFFCFVQQVEYYEVYKQFVDIFEKKMAEFLDEKGFSTQEFVNAVENAIAEDKQGAESFGTVFVELMEVRQVQKCFHGCFKTHALYTVVNIEHMVGSWKKEQWGGQRSCCGGMLNSWQSATGKG